MKSLYCFILLLPNLLFAQQASDIEGVWLNEPGDAQIEIKYKNDSYYGSIVWLQSPKDKNGNWKLDIANPDKSLRTRKKLGLEILSQLKWDENDKEWTDGEIYDPRKGDTYSLKANLSNQKTLNLRGFMGFSLFGKTTIWTRVE